MKIIFFGTEFVEDIVWNLNENFDLKLVLTINSHLSEYCKIYKINCANVLRVDEDLIKKLKLLNPDLGVVANFGKILPQKLIDIFPKGIINIHPSLLPKYRGPSPIQTAILNGDKNTGITIFKLDEKIDHGPILYQKTFTINNTYVGDSLTAELFKKSAPALVDVIKHLDDIDPTAQDESKASYTKLVTKKDGFIELSKPPKKDILERMIRAYDNWPGVWTRLRLSSSGQTRIVKLLPDQKIQVEGKSPMSYKDFINGYPNGRTFLEKMNLVASG